MEPDSEQKKPRLALLAGCAAEASEEAEFSAPTGGLSIPLARALADLGFEVVVFCRGAQGSKRFAPRPGLRLEELPARIRSARGEDAVAEIEKDAEWLEEHLSERAAAQGLPPWQQFELLVSEGWRAGLLAEILLCRWRARLVGQAAERLLAGVAPEQLLEKIIRSGCEIGLGDAPSYFLGKLLLNAEGSPATPILQRARMAAMKFSRLRGSEGGTEADQLMGAVAGALAESRNRTSPALQELVVAETLGQSLLDINPTMVEWLEREMELVDRHLWISDLARAAEDLCRCRSNARRQQRKQERIYRQMVCDRAGAFVVGTGWEAEALLGQFRVPWEQMFYMPPGVEEGFADAPPVGQELLDFLSGAGVDGQLIEGRLVILEYGPAWPSRRKEMVLDAFSVAARERPDILLIMAGGGDGFQKLAALRESREELRRQTVLLENVPVELLSQLFSLADVFVSASELESDGWALVQAAASQKAIVCTESQLLAVKFLSPEAVVVPEGEIFDLAHGVLDLVENDENCRQRGRQLAEKAARLDFRVQARALVDYLIARGFRITRPPGW